MGRRPIGKQAMSGAERTRQYRERLRHSKPVTKPSEPAQGELAAEITRLQQKLAQAHKRIAGLEAKLADAGRRELTRTRGGVEFGEAAKLRAPREYYSDRDEATLAAAKRVLALVQSIMPIPIRSAADVGCGAGTWLAVLLENDCEDIVGYDGEWVPTEYLRIPADRLIRCDLAHQRIGADKRYDLAMCLECAEHCRQKLRIDSLSCFAGSPISCFLVRRCLIKLARVTLTNIGPNIGRGCSPNAAMFASTGYGRNCGRMSSFRGGIARTFYCSSIRNVEPR
jgi:hypothetical protein